MSKMSTHSHHFAHWPFADPHNTASYCTAKVAREHYPILQVSHDADGDWQFLDATTEQPGECVIVCMACIYERDSSLEAIADLPRGWSAWRDAIGGPWERGENPPEVEEDECANTGNTHHKLQQDIERYGCQVLCISAEDELPPFAYSIGIQASSGAPEVVVIGLQQEMAQSVMNTYNDRVRAGEHFVVGQRYGGFLGGHDIQFGAVDRSHYGEYFGTAAAYYGHTDFAVLQIIYPTTTGIWPWEAGADEWFQRRQPLLARPPK